jgi:hypothetical protein
MFDDFFGPVAQLTSSGQVMAGIAAAQLPKRKLPFIPKCCCIA